MVGIISWFAIVITGKQPRGMWDFLLKAQRYTLQLQSYGLLMTDTYPKFGEGAPPWRQRARSSRPLLAAGACRLIVQGREVLPDGTIAEESGRHFDITDEELTDSRRWLPTLTSQWATMLCRCGR